MIEAGPNKKARNTGNSARAGSKTTVSSVPKVNKAVVYVRVSSRKQQSTGDGLGSQEATCRTYASGQGYEVDEVFREVLSGGASDRPAMKSLLAYLRQHKMEGRYVIVDDISRFSRGHEAHWALRKELERAGGFLCSPKMEFGNTANHRLVEGVMVTISQHHRELNAEQVQDRMFGRLLNGYWPFAAPVGYRQERVSGHAGRVMVRDEPVASIIQEALEGYASGRFETQTEVKRFLESQPAFPKKMRDGSGEVRYPVVYILLTKLIYAGYVEYKNWGVSAQKGRHEPLISLETYERIQERLHGKPKAAIRSDTNADFPLRGTVCCEACGKPMCAAWSRSKTGARHGYYFCFQKKACVRSRKSIRRADIEGAFEVLLQQLTPTPRLVELARSMFSEAWRQKTAQVGELAATCKREIGRIEREVGKLVDLIVNTESVELTKVLERKVTALERQKLRFEEQLAQSSRAPGSFDELFELAVQFLSKPYDLWRSGSLVMRKLVLRLTFADRLVWSASGGFRTPETTLPFKLLASFRDGNSRVVSPMGFEPMTY